MSMANVRFSLLGLIGASLCIQVLIVLYLTGTKFEDVRNFINSNTTFVVRHDRAYITLCTDDKFLNLAEVWAYSLTQSGSLYKKIVLTTKNMSEEGRSKLRKVGCEIVEAEVIPKPPAPRGRGGRTFRADRENVFTKLWIWNMTSYSSLIFMDSDTIALKNIDHLFENDQVSLGKIAAVFYCDIHCDCQSRFNSGVMVIRPSTATFESLLAGFHTLSWGGQGDQAYLNAYFKRNNSVVGLHHWYNMGKNVARCAFDELWVPDEFNVFHFAGNDKTHPDSISWANISSYDDSLFTLDSLRSIGNNKTREKIALLGMQKRWHTFQRRLHGSSAPTSFTF